MRLPKFCFHCGVIRHGKGGCFSLQNRSKPRKEMDYPYGQWLRVSFPVRKGNSVEPQWRKREDSGKKVGQGMEHSLVIARKMTFGRWMVTLVVVVAPPLMVF